MRLQRLISNLGIGPVRRLNDIEIKGISSDSRQIHKDYLFVAIDGKDQDGHNFIPEAISQGASAVIYRQGYPLADSRKANKVIFIPASDTRIVLSAIASRFYGHPSGRLKVIGITGTNGKTTVSYLIESILKAAGRKTGLIGTINYRFMGQEVRAINTTPGAVEIQQLLSQMLASGVEYVVMEVSSHSLHQGRVRDIEFKTAVFTNLTQDHLDYHRDLEDYFSVKKGLFLDLKQKPFCIINRDNPYGARLLAEVKPPVLTYGINSQSDILAEEVELNLSGCEFIVRAPNFRSRIISYFLGMHNVYNILASIGVCVAEGIDLDFIKQGIKGLEFVPGRLQPIRCGQPYQIFVDYAHTEDALKNILASLRQIQEYLHKKSRLILVFGCGGRRDKSKRKKMASVASSLADFCIITNDNPRDEDPNDIANDIVAGIINDNFEVILDRFQAIKKALSLAGKDDIVVVAGKGHENYQIFKHKSIPFDDSQVIKEILGNHGA